jgi:hypothetical protein
LAGPRINHQGCAMQNPVKFREYAEECKRLAQQTAGENRAILLEIAKAWINCAEDAERNQRIRRNSAAASPENVDGHPGASERRPASGKSED